MTPALPTVPHPAPAHVFWGYLTRLGEAQVLLPALAVVMLWWCTRPGTRQVAATWLACVAAATALTTATKLAFIGWGVGSAALDFTGISGHSMFAAAVLPLLLASATATGGERSRWTALGLAYALAGGVAVSRVLVQAHSVSEALAGFATGALASALALRLARPPAQRPPLGLLAGVAACCAVLMAGTPPAPTHALVTRMALALSGHRQPCTRAMLLQRRSTQAPRWLPHEVSRDAVLPVP